MVTATMETERVVESARSFSQKDQAHVMKSEFKQIKNDAYHLVLAPSYACNMLCNHCFLPHHNPSGLQMFDVLRLIDQWSEIVVAERGKMGGTFHLKGGEPLMLPYLTEILDHLADRKTLRFMMTTNGINGRRICLQHLISLNAALIGNVQVVVSIDGSNDAVNSKFRGRGYFWKAVRFVRHLRDAGITVHLNNVVHQENIDDIEAFVELAMYLDVEKVNFIPFVARGSIEKMRYGSPDLVDLHHRIQSVMDNRGRKVKAMLLGTLGDIYYKETADFDDFHNHIGIYKGVLHIVPDGTVYALYTNNHSGLKAGNIFKETLAEIHDRLGHKLYAVRTSDAPIDFHDYE